MNYGRYGNSKNLPERTFCYLFGVAGARCSQRKDCLAICRWYLHVKLRGKFKLLITLEHYIGMAIATF
jgi:hypothetical protein